jgi:beta-aspartyl-peptidase (threonine type)
MALDQVVFSFAFHGGAGVIPKGSIDSDIYQPSLETILRKIYAYAESNLSNDNVSAVDVAEFAVKALEDDPLYNAGKGAVLATNGEHQLEASIMNGATLQSGAVSMIRNYANPISLARLVMEKTPHVYMMGDGAESLAAQHGCARVPDNSYFSTKLRLAQLAAAKDAEGVYGDHGIPNTATAGDDSEELASQLAPESSPMSPVTVLGDTDTGTVGCVCYYKGTVAAATSTGGMTNKLSGRIGDSPLIGSGTYANNLTCAVSGTGKSPVLFLLAV